MDKKEYKCKFCDKAKIYHYTNLSFLCQFQGNMVRGGTTHCLGDQQERLPQGRQQP